MSKGYAFLLLLLMLPWLAFGEGFGSRGSQSLLRLQTASVLNPQRLDIRTDLNFFTKLGDYLGSSKPPNFNAVNYWVVQSNLLGTYGLAEHFDATLKVQLYQDVHKENEYNAPGDIFLNLKAGSFGFSDNKIIVGGQFGMRIPTGDVSNYPFEDYTAGALEFGLMFIGSYFNDPFLPHRDFSFHMNLQWWYHNDAGKTLIKQTAPDGTVLFEAKAGNNAAALRYGLGFAYPTELFNLNFELWGNHFTSKPDTFAFSRENYLYVTPSIRFKPSWWVNLDLGVDVRISSDENTSSSLISFRDNNLDLPNYPSWRLFLGSSFVINPGKDRIKGGIGGQPEIKDKVDFYEKLLREREKTRSIEEELRRLKREREQAEKELEELRQLLEEEGK
jgi:hypothetical protein